MYWAWELAGGYAEGGVFEKEKEPVLSVVVVAAKVGAKPGLPFWPAYQRLTVAPITG